MLKKLLAILISALPVGCSAAQQTINVGTPDAGNGDTLRSAFVKVNSNFDEVYSLAVSRAESFGAVADDGLDDYAAIMSALGSYGTVVLGPGQYDISERVMLTSNQSIYGAGRDITVLRLMDNCAAYSAIPTTSPLAKYQVIRSDNPATNITVMGLTVDGNIENQSNPNFTAYTAVPQTHTMNPVSLGGNGHRIEQVKAIGWGVGSLNGISGLPNVTSTYAYTECFPILISDSNSGANPNAAQSYIVDCEVTTPCYDFTTAALTAPSSGGDVSAIVIQSDTGGVISGNNIHDIHVTTLNNITDGTGWSPGGQLLGITAYGSNIVVAGNTVSRFYGTGLWIGDSWHNFHITYDGNMLDGVRVGAQLNQNASGDNDSVDSQSWTDLKVINNYFRGYGNVDISQHFLAGETPSYYDKRRQHGMIISGEQRMTNVVVANNVFSFGNWEYDGTERTAFDFAFYLDTTAMYENITIANNIFTSTKLDGTVYWNHIPWYKEGGVALDTSKVSSYGNRTLDGLVMLRDRFDNGSGLTAFDDETFTFYQASASAIPTPVANRHRMFFDADDDTFKVKMDDGGYGGFGGSRIHTTANANAGTAAYVGGVFDSYNLPLSTSWMSAQPYQVVAMGRDGAMAMVGVNNGGFTTAFEHVQLDATGSTLEGKWGQYMNNAVTGGGYLDTYYGTVTTLSSDSMNLVLRLMPAGYFQVRGDAPIISLYDDTYATATDRHWGIVSDNGSFYVRNYDNSVYGTPSTALTVTQTGDLTVAGSVRVGGGTGALILSGTGTPESAVTASVGAMFLRTDGGAGTTLYVKESGTGNTGWVAK